jgi:cysteine dioxygenase
LSTDLDTSSRTAVGAKSGHDSLAALVEAIEAAAAVPTLPEIFHWLEHATISGDELKPYTGFKEGNYWRHRVCRTEFIEMLVLCWRPGQRTPIHDHNGSHGGVKIWKGVLWETTFAYDALKGLQYTAARELQAGSVTGSEIPDVHQLGNPDVSGQDLITIHIYAPPLGVLHTYKPGSNKIDLYVPDDLDELN